MLETSVWRILADSISNQTNVEKYQCLKRKLWLSDYSLRCVSDQVNGSEKYPRPDESIGDEELRQVLYEAWVDVGVSMLRMFQYAPLIGSIGSKVPRIDMVSLQSLYYIQQFGSKSDDLGLIELKKFDGMLDCTVWDAVNRIFDWAKYTFQQNLQNFCGVESVENCLREVLSARDIWTALTSKVQYNWDKPLKKWVSNGHVDRQGVKEAANKLMRCGKFPSKHESLFSYERNCISFTHCPEIEIPMTTTNAADSSDGRTVHELGFQYGLLPGEIVDFAKNYLMRKFAAIAIGVTTVSVSDQTKEIVNGDAVIKLPLQLGSETSEITISEDYSKMTMPSSAFAKLKAAQETFRGKSSSREIGPLLMLNCDVINKRRVSYSLNSVLSGVNIARNENDEIVIDFNHPLGLNGIPELCVCVRDWLSMKNCDLSALKVNREELFKELKDGETLFELKHYSNMFSIGSYSENIFSGSTEEPLRFMERTYFCQSDRSAELYMSIPDICHVCGLSIAMFTWIKELGDLVVHTNTRKEGFCPNIFEGWVNIFDVMKLQLA